MYAAPLGAKSFAPIKAVRFIEIHRANVHAEHLAKPGGPQYLDALRDSQFPRRRSLNTSKGSRPNEPVSQAVRPVEPKTRAVRLGASRKRQKSFASKMAKWFLCACCEPETRKSRRPNGREIIMSNDAEMNNGYALTVERAKSFPEQDESYLAVLR